MRLRLQLTGDAALKKELRRLEALYPDALGAALYQEGMAVWRSAVKKAPVEFGVMRNSAYVSPPMREGRDIVIETGFGTKYAVFQHETRGLEHPRGGDSHFLKRALEEVAGGFLARLVARTNQNVQRKVRAPVIAAPTRPAAPAAVVRRRRRRRLRR